LSHTWPAPGPAAPSVDLTAGIFAQSVLLGVSQFMFIDTLVGGMLTFLAILIASRKVRAPIVSHHRVTFRPTDHSTAPVDFK